MKRFSRNRYVTEVHHIDPKGHDSGVVYSEMQGRENTSGDLMSLRCVSIIVRLTCLLISFKNATTSRPSGKRLQK
jgi:hypothetical protein